MPRVDSDWTAGRYCPESVNGDAFLPNQLRSQLGLMDNARRYARDCYALLTMQMTRRHFEILFNLLSVDGDPKRRAVSFWRYRTIDWQHE